VAVVGTSSRPESCAGGVREYPKLSAIREEGVWMLPPGGLHRSNPSGRGMVYQISTLSTGIYSGNRGACNALQLARSRLARFIGIPIEAIVVEGSHLGRGLTHVGGGLVGVGAELLKSLHLVSRLVADLCQ